MHGVTRHTHTQHASACTSLHLQHTFLLSHVTLYLMYTCLCVMLCVCACVDAWVELATVTLSYSQCYVQSSLKMDV